MMHTDYALLEYLRDHPDCIKVQPNQYGKPKWHWSKDGKTYVEGYTMKTCINAAMEAE